MDNPVWLKIWLAVLAVPVTIGFFPFIVMHFKVKKRPMWEHRIWHENRIAKWFIAMPKGGYSQQTWTAIRPQPLLYFVVGIIYFVFVGLFVFDQIWSLPLGLIVLPMVLHDLYLFDFGMDAEWRLGGFNVEFVIQETLMTAAVLVPLIWLAQDVAYHIASTT